MVKTSNKADSSLSALAPPHAASTRARLANARRSISAALQQEAPLTREEYEAFLLELDSIVDSIESAADEVIEREDEIESSWAALAGENQGYHDHDEFAPEASFVTNDQGIILQANLSASALLLVPQPYVIGKPLSIYIGQNQRREFRARLRTLATNGEAAVFDTWFAPRGGDPVKVRVSATPLPDLRDATGERRYVHWYLRPLNVLDTEGSVVREQIYRVTFDQAAVGMAHISAQGQWQRVNRKLCDILGYSAQELLLMTIADITHPEDVQRTRWIHQQLVAGTIDYETFESVYVRKDGAHVHTHLTVSSVRSAAGEYLYAIAVVEDISLRKQIEAAEREQRSLARALRDAGLSISGTLQLSEVLDQILVSIERVVPHDLASIMLIEDGAIRWVRTRGYDEHGLSDLKRALGSLSVSFSQAPILRFMAETRQPILIPEWRHDGFWKGLPQASALQGFLGLPLVARDDLIGFLVFHSLRPHFFSVKHRDWLEIFGAQAAIAIENARIHEHARQMAVIEERQRLARDLHDAVTQTIFSANLLAESLPRLYRKKPEKTLQNLEQLHVLTRAALAEMRALLLELRPDQLEKLDLGTQLQQLADAARGRKRIDVSLDLKNDAPLPVAVQVALYRIAQEAINNIIKHARARRVSLSLHGDSQEITLIVHDDGIGFDSSTRRSGMGMDSMRERAEEIGARLHIESGPGEGCRVAVHWRRKDL